MKRTFSTGYFTFGAESEYKEFFAEWNGHTFLDEKGNVYKLQIEIALHQKVQSKKQKLPEGCGTYAETDDYKKFLENISKEAEKAPSADQLEDEKTAPQVAPLAVELSETRTTKGTYTKRSRRPNKGQKAQKEELKYVIKKRSQEGSKEAAAEPKEETAANKQRGKTYYGGKNGGGGIVYRKKQPKDETK